MIAATTYDPKEKRDEIRGRDIVVISIQPWYYELGSNCKNMALALSENNRVLYVNAPINRKTYYSRKKNSGIQQHCSIIRHGREKIKKINDSMWEYYPTTIIESINGLPSTTLFRFFNRINNRRFAKDIRGALQELKFQNIILFNDNDIYNGYHLKEMLSPELYVYYCRDFLQGYPYWKKHCSVLEPKLIAKADVAVTNSTYYAEYCSRFNPHSFYIGQGCNLELFNAEADLQMPAELTGLSRPLIGYVGALDSQRLNPEILQKIAENDKWQLVLVGPPDEVFSNSPLKSLPNVHFLGRRNLPDLPAYVKAFDVCINPQSINEVTKGNYPLKIDEYLAMGKPVVATRTPAMKLFEPYTYLADAPEEYTGLIRRALKEDSELAQKERIAFAWQHSWKNTMAEFASVVLNFRKMT
jgi:teichuronic acid biosynthesis glycosyltransferase TuaH